MKRLISGLLVGLLTVSLVAGCSGKPAANESNSAAQGGSKKIKIGVSVATMKEAVYTFMKKAIEEQAQKDGVEIVWVSADNDEQKQLNDVQNLLSQKVNALILHAVNTGAASNLVAQAKNAGVPVVAMDRLPEKTKDIALYVTADSKKVGQVQAEFVAKQLGGKGKVIILEGEAGNGVARDITAGNKEVLAKYPDIKIVASQAHQHWSSELAMNTVTNILTKEKNDIQAILANNTGMAMGAVQALKQAGLGGKVVVVGSDADLNGLQSIIDGDGLTADVDKKPIQLGLESYKAAVAAAKGEKLKGDTEVDGIQVKLTPIELITKENVMTMTYRWPELNNYKKK
jgi:ABC-type sugar transport system substrate-binding protein